MNTKLRLFLIAFLTFGSACFSLPAIYALACLAEGLPLSYLVNTQSVFETVGGSLVIGFGFFSLYALGFVIERVITGKEFN